MNSFFIGRARLVCRFLILTALLSTPAAQAGTKKLPAWKQRLMPPSDSWKKTKQELVFNNGTEPESLDPALIKGVPEMRVVQALFEGLVNLDPETLEPRPGLAESWDIAADRRHYTFHLRKNARWSDGRPVTAVEVLQSWKRVITPSTGAAYAYQLYPVKGAEAFHHKKVAFAQVGLAAPDARTLKVELTVPCPYFLDLAAFPTLFPVRIELIQRYGSSWTRPGRLIGNGPYVLREWKPRERIVLERNEQYWDRRVCHLTRITALPYDDLDTAYKLYLQKKIDWLPGIPLTRLDEIKQNADYYVTPYLGVYFYRFNVTRPPFNDARVRRAFSMAIDRSVITDQVLRGGQKPTAAFCPPIGAYHPEPGLKYDRDGARTLLRAAGYGTGKGLKPLPTVEIFYNTSEAHKQVAETVAQQWKRNLGVRVSLRNTEWKIFLGDMNDLNYQVARSSWIGDYGDPNTFFDMWVSKGGNNRTGWSNAEYDRLLKESQNTSPEKRLELFKRMEKILVEQECPIMPIYFYVNQGLIRESICGWYENIRDIHPFKYIWLSTRQP